MSTQQGGHCGANAGPCAWRWGGALPGCSDPGTQRAEHLHPGEGSGWKLGWSVPAGQHPPPPQEHVPREMGTSLISVTHTKIPRLRGSGEISGSALRESRVYRQSTVPWFGIPAPLKPIRGPRQQPRLLSNTHTLSGLLSQLWAPRPGDLSFLPSSRQQSLSSGCTELNEAAMGPLWV